MLSGKYRLKKNYQFAFIYKKGDTVPSKHLVLIFAPSRAVTKIGFSVSNKIGKAVLRNKVKRRMRAAARELLPAFALGYSFIFAARKDIAEIDYAGILNEMSACLQEANSRIQRKKSKV